MAELTDKSSGDASSKSSLTIGDGGPESPDTFNTVGLISFILTGVAAGLCAVMFLLADGLPNSPSAFSNDATTPAQLRLLILGCSTAVLAAVALVMSVIAMLIPFRNRTMAVLSAIGALLILVGVFGVIVLAIILTDPEKSSASIGQQQLQQQQQQQLLLNARQNHLMRA